MEAHSVDRRLASLAAALAMLVALAASLEAVSNQDDRVLFTGAGFGPTVEVAIQAAIWDAEASGGVYQFFSCQLVGEPEVFPGPDPARSRNFTAQVTMECSPTGRVTAARTAHFGVKAQLGRSWDG